MGSGKSSLCQSLLGEMKRTKGTIVKKGKIAYVPQQVEERREEKGGEGRGERREEGREEKKGFLIL